MSAKILDKVKQDLRDGSFFSDDCEVVDLSQITKKPKVKRSFRVDEDVLEYFDDKYGRGWTSMISKYLFDRMIKEKAAELKELELRAKA